jgi:hypothetical protein
MPCCKGIAAVVYDFSNWASDDGFHHTANAKRAWLKVTWIVLYLLCWAVFFYQLYGCITKYLGYPFNVGTSVGPSAYYVPQCSNASYNSILQLYYQGMPFPAITICHLNPVKFSHFAINDPSDTFMQLVSARDFLNGSHLLSVLYT